jgi:cellulose synthase/poly-beta-1,6-N-acetylglucosamine synthase-like glycosyltransferase
VSLSSAVFAAALGALAVYAAYLALLAWGWRRARQMAPAVPDAEASGAEAPGGDDPRGACLPAVSVIVAARNEEAVLPALLDALDRQRHPDFEVVVVDDASADGTADVVRDRADADPHVRLVRVREPRRPRKKHALTRGVEAARHDLLAFTDADCAPGPGWLTGLAQAHARTPRDTVLVGYSPVEDASGLLGGFARYETFVAGAYAAATAGLRRPYLAVGRNLSYPRAVFERAGGFEHSAEAMSGDDDLFVQHVARTGAADVRPLLAPTTFVPTRPPDSWRGWFRSRRRHVSAGRLYPAAIGMHLALFHGAGLLLWLAPLGLGLTGDALRGAGLLAAGLLLRKAALDAPARALGETAATALFPLWELGYSLYHLILPAVGLASPPDEW